MTYLETKLSKNKTLKYKTQDKVLSIKFHDRSIHINFETNLAKLVYDLPKFAMFRTWKTETTIINVSI